MNYYAARKKYCLPIDYSVLAFSMKIYNRWSSVKNTRDRCFNLCKYKNLLEFEDADYNFFVKMPIKFSLSSFIMKIITLGCGIINQVVVANDKLYACVHEKINTTKYRSDLFHR